MYVGIEERGAATMPFGAERVRNNASRALMVFAEMRPEAGRPVPRVRAQPFIELLHSLQPSARRSVLPLVRPMPRQGPGAAPRRNVRPASARCAETGGEWHRIEMKDALDDPVRSTESGPHVQLMYHPSSGRHWHNDLDRARRILVGEVKKLARASGRQS